MENKPTLKQVLNLMDLINLNDYDDKYNIYFHAGHLVIESKIIEMGGYNGNN